ncbi:TonB-dependent receptor [Neolewinella antarctica]|uniref:TonB-dependent receptor plug domain-containing protein n=1 Tax=Neolewinella antarctica TaxID=442734 RepID=A0ABX0X6I6_9BACT|nr:carboxypeptidase-like regulatory domain-containing protein [Neolewinella antarctica]NJC24604.1 hypothetical protein [Neolewinella antarctica]
MRLYLLPLLLFFLGQPVAEAQTNAGTDVEYKLPRRTLVLEKALIKLREEGAQLSYRPDQLPQLSLKVPGGKKSLGGWLSFLLQDTELTYQQSAAGYLVYPDATLPEQMLNVYGVVQDKETGERLIGAAVQVRNENRGVLTNEYGFYSLPVNGGNRRLRVTYIGYQPYEDQVLLRQDSTFDISLVPDRTLPAVIVRAAPATGAGLYLMDTRASIGREEVDRTAGLGGQADPLRVARLLPGVESGADGVGGIFIRGSESGHNLVLLDGVPVYNVNHAAGIFSIFNNEAIRRVDLYKDGMPARFGGRIGGVLDVHTRDGNLYDHRTSVSTSLLAAQVTSEGPITEGQSSYLVAGRYFWAGNVLRQASERYKQDRGRQGRIDYDVYDVNFKLNQQLGKRGRLYLSAFRGVDHYSNYTYATDTVTVLNPAGAVFRYATPRSRFEEVNWTNTVAALRYNHVFNRRLFGNFRLSLSDLSVDAAYERSDSLNEVNLPSKTGDIFSGRYGSDIGQIGLAFDGQYTLTNDSELRFGFEGNRHSFTPLLNSSAVPLSFHPELSSVSKTQAIEPEEVVGYASFSGAFRGVNYRAGMRLQWWINGTNYVNASPRLLLAGQFSPKTTWRLAFDRTVQSVHQVSSTVIGLPSEMWVPSTREVAPSTATQVSANFQQRFWEDWNLEVATYYRDLRRLVSFREGGDEENWVNNLSRGQGFARGAEFTLSRATPKFRGWLSYVLSQSRRQFDDKVNAGRPFDFRYGRRHAVKVFALYMPTPSVSLSATWHYGSGANYSLSRESFWLVDPTRLSDEDRLQTVDLIEEKNGVRLPANHRLDVNAQFEWRRAGGSRFGHTLDIGIYNVYSRHNPIYYDIQTDYFSRDEQLVANRDFIQVYLAPITPTLAYRLTFGRGGGKPGQ